MGLNAEFVPVKVQEKLLTEPGATVWLIGVTSKLFASGSSPVLPKSKNASTESNNDCSAAFAEREEKVKSSPPRSMAAESRFKSADREVI